MEMKKILLRREALSLELARFFTGKPCKRGHICERYTSTSHCVQCDADGRALYRAANRQKIRAKNKLYRVTNREKLITKDKARRVHRKPQAEMPLPKAGVEFPKPLLAKPIPAPDWSVIGHNPKSIERRAQELRKEYREQKRAGGSLTREITPANP